MGDVMTSTITLLPIIAALFTANNFQQLHDAGWNTVNTQQQIFINQYWPNVTDLALLKANELESKASKDVSIINQFLKEHNFTIQLADMHDPLAFYVASILKVALEWETIGIKTTLNVNAKNYPAVKFDNQVGQGVKIYETTSDYLAEKKNQILEIKAKNGDLVYMMKKPNEQTPLVDFALLDAIERSWQKNITTEHQRYYDEAIFPMVDLNQEVDIKWLENIGTSSGCMNDYIVAQALQQTKFQMNEKGAKVESAVAIGCRCTCFRPKQIFIINEPFYLWIIRPGMKTPIFAAFINTDAWKAPAE